MTKTEILEGNKLIIDFMVYYDSGTTDNHLNSVYRINILGSNTFHTIETIPLHKSWDFLMPVVEKINKLIIDTKKSTIGEGIIIQYDCVYLYYKTYRSTRIVGNGNNRFKDIKEAIFITVVEFIKWYNNEQKSIS